MCVHQLGNTGALATCDCWHSQPAPWTSHNIKLMHANWSSLSNHLPAITLIILASPCKDQQRDGWKINAQRASSVSACHAQTALLLNSVVSITYEFAFVMYRDEQHSLSAVVMISSQICSRRNTVSGKPIIPPGLFGVARGYLA